MTAVTTTPRSVGAGIERIDGLQKVTGTARYAFEHPVPNAAYAVPVLSTIARGRVLAVDGARALAEPGVLSVLDATNAPRLEPVDGANGELFILQSPEVVYRGQIVGGVIATSLEAAREAADLVAVTYDERPHQVLLREDDPAIYTPEHANAGEPGLREIGDVDAALAAAPVTVQARYTTAVNLHQPMEPHATIAVWEHDGLTLYNADQGPFFTARAIAALFGLATEQVRVIAEHVGGGFGSKGSPRPPLMLAALAARHVGRPVKVALTRQQMFSLVTHRPPSIQHVRLGADRDGRLVAIDHHAITHSSRLVEYVDQIGATTLMMYASPNRRVRHSVARLDVPTPAYMRAPGHATGAFALEVALDELAERVGVDPIELRVRNEPDVDPASGLDFSSRNLVGCLREGAERFGWADRGPGGAAAPRREGRWIVGTGVASAHHPDYTMASTAHARALPSGDFEVEIAAADLGTGARTALLQIAADALEADLGAVSIRIGDSSIGPATLAGGSMGTASWGWAVSKACRGLREELAATGEIPPEGVRVSADTTEDLKARERLSRHTFGAHFAEVWVDADTGELRVARMLGVFAAGRIINARTARSQFYGGMIWALSQALHERGEIDAVFGDFANHDLASYHFAANADIGRLEVHWLPEEDRSPNPTGAKGIGELGIVGGAAAIANAISHATGHRFRDLPIRIEDVRRALSPPA